MKKICILMAVMLLTLSACAAGPDNTAGNTEANPAANPAANPTANPTANPAEAQSAADGTNSDVKTAGTAEKAKDDSEVEKTMKLLIGQKEVPVTWEENASVEALRALCPLTIQMSMYGGFEQVGPIGQSIVSDDVQTNTNYGDIVLYSGNQVVIVYGSNSWAYTRLGHVNLSQKEMSDLLSKGDTVITLK